MNFGEISNNVIEITARPDKVGAIAVAINRAVHYATIIGNFHQDLVETSIPINPTLYADTISLAALVRFRRFKYVKPTGVKYYLTPLAPEYIFTPQRTIQPNKYYLSGTSMTYTLSTLCSQLEVGYYTYPPVLDSTTNNHYWLLDACPYAIIDLAAAKIFADIGDEASAKRHEIDGMQMLLAFRGDVVQGE